MATDPPIPPAQRQLAERRLLAALRRLHRRAPLRAEVRVDTLLAALADAPGARGGHRGSAPLTLDDAQLRQVLDAMRTDGRLAGDGRRVRLPQHEPRLDPQMAERVRTLLDGLDEAGPLPPAVEGVAARLGIPPTVIEQLRDAGELVHLGPGIDYPRGAWERLDARIDRLAASGALSTSRVRESLRVTRRHAEALLRRHRAARRSYY